MQIQNWLTALTQQKNTKYLKISNMQGTYVNVNALMYITRK